MKLTKYILINILLLTLSCCNNNVSNNESINNSELSDSSISNSLSSDLSWFNVCTGDNFISPNLDSELSINILLKTNNQNKVYKDIGNFCFDENDPQYDNYTYHPEDVNSFETARLFASASAFKRLAPGIKINLQTYTDENKIDFEYDYYHITNNFEKYLKLGKLFDLKIASNMELYHCFNEYLMSRFNYGGFQVAFPYTVIPKGIYVNTNDLSKYSIVEDNYEQYVNSFTYEKFINSLMKATNEIHFGINSMNPEMLSYSLKGIYQNYIDNQKIDLTSESVTNDVSSLLEYENKIAKYISTNKSIDDKQSFYVDELYTFMNSNMTLEEHRFYIDRHNYIYVKDINPKIDLLPYPMIYNNEVFTYGLEVEGLGVIDARNYTNNKEKAMNENIIAASFIMFSCIDPRAIEQLSFVKFQIPIDNIDNEFYRNKKIEYKNALTLPVSKRGNKLSWQANDEYVHIHDPAEDYFDNWSYQLFNYFSKNNIFLTNDEDLDVEDFSNLTYGIKAMLDSIYMLDGFNDDIVTCLAVNNELIDKTNDIFSLWNNRYYDSDELIINTSKYVEKVINNLSLIEEDINNKINRNWSEFNDVFKKVYLDDENMPCYNMLDFSERKEYDGTR